LKGMYEPTEDWPNVAVLRKKPKSVIFKLLEALQRALPGFKGPPIREAQIEREICDYLHLKGLFFWKQPQAGFFDGTCFRPHASPYVKKGVPDLIVIRRGQFIGLEIKRPGSYQSNSQKVFQMQLQRAGGKYYVVRSLQEVRAFFEGL
jgi:hypothetical protein